MTRATLLQVLARPTALGSAEVRELEQLAQAFPYCQTAHLLLAKAAHDQGTMLAGQRLRRAATYAADRTLLRRLIETAEPVATPEATAPEAAEPTNQPATAAAVPEPEVPVAAPPAIPAIAEAEAEIKSEMPIAATVEAPAINEAATAPIPAAEPLLPSTEPAVDQLPAHSAEPPVVQAATPEASAEPFPEAVAAPEPPQPRETDLPVLVDLEDVHIPVVAPAPELAPETMLALESAPEIEPDLPPQAPAIRPPVEVGEARFEFGLAETGPPATPTYELPGLVDEWAASAVTRTLGGPEPLAEILALADPAPAVFTPAAFTGNDTIGYAFGESSRLGFSMQLLNLLADQAESAEGTAALTATAQPPAGPLPPAGAFFEPDPLLLEHWATHCPPAPALPSSLDLINNFLRRQPRLTRPAMLPPSPTTQADLSVRSTRAEPDLASESLARILVRQGKTARAIEIYEKLMVKQPEKMAYFAAQIQLLQPSA